MEEKLRGELLGQKPKGMRWYQYIWLALGLAFATTIPKYFGPVFLMPVLFTYLCAFAIIFAISKLKKDFPKPMMWGLAMQTGQLIGSIIVVVTDKSYTFLFLLGIILLTGVLIWLLFKPRLVPVILLTIYNGICILLAVKILSNSSALPDFAQKSLMLRIFLSIFTIFYLIEGFIKIYRDKRSCKISIKADKEKELKKEKGLCSRCGTRNPPDAFRCRNENCLEILPQV